MSNSALSSNSTSLSKSSTLPAELSSLRKAAVLIAAIDQRTAAALLSQLPPEYADAVLQEAGAMGEVDLAQQEKIFEEFCRVGPLIPEADPPGLEIDDSLRGVLQNRPESDNRVAPYMSESKSSLMGGQNANAPFAFLRKADPAQLLPFLKREHPQTVALVLAHLPPASASQALSQLPSATQAEALRRMVNLDKTDRQVLRDVELAVKSWWHERQDAAANGNGVAVISAILNSADGAARRQILSNLALHDRRLASRFSQQSTAAPHFTFADLSEFDSDSLVRLAGAIDGEILVLALAGAGPEFIDRLLDCLPTQEARLLDRRLERTAPARVAEIDRAN